MPGGRILIAAVSSALLGLIWAGSALACSCSPSTPAESLASADAALTARLLSVEAHGPDRAEYRYEALRVYRGREAIEPGSTLTVLSSLGSAACALPDRIGQSYGLFLLGGGRGWVGGRCGVISPRRLWLTAREPAAGQATGSLASCTS